MDHHLKTEHYIQHKYKISNCIHYIENIVQVIIPRHYQLK